MKKIISLFRRDYNGTRQVYNEVTPGAEWVIAGEGVATEKIDGTCCMVRDGKLYKRYDAKNGKVPPQNFEPAQPDPDQVTGHWPGWVPVGDGPKDAWHREAWSDRGLSDGTYELVGPKIQGNPYKMSAHLLILHGDVMFAPDIPRDFESIKRFLAEYECEGIVWHRGNGDMVKIKSKDFGLQWPRKEMEVEK